MVPKYMIVKTPYLKISLWVCFQKKYSGKDNVYMKVIQPPLIMPKFTVVEMRRRKKLE